MIKNAHNSVWLNNKNLISELKKKIKNDIFSENDANCFSLSEALDGEELRILTSILELKNGKI